MRGPCAFNRCPWYVIRGRPLALRGPWSVVRGPWSVFVIFCGVRKLQVAHALDHEPRAAAIFPVADQHVTRAGPQKTGRLFAFGG